MQHHTNNRTKTVALYNVRLESKRDQIIVTGIIATKLNLPVGNSKKL